MITIEQAVRKLKSRLDPLGTEEIPVLKSAGRILREDLSSPHAIPPFDKSAMDGYAVRAADVADASVEAPAVLKVLEDIPAGQVGNFRLRKGTTARIMTGAPLPAGADAVVMVEDTVMAPEGVLIRKAATRGANVGPAGEDVKKGETVLTAGTLLGAAEMGMIAATGRSRIEVSIRPKVRIVSTGSEILKPGVKLRPGHIYDANGYSLTGLAGERGAEARFLGIAADRKGALEQKIAQAEDADLLVLSGGVSVGDYDLVQDILLGLGVEQIFHKVRIKPGMPTFAGVRGTSFVLGLPGHPVSCMVTFMLFAGVIIDTMLGRNTAGPRRTTAILSDSLRLKPARRKYLRGIVENSDGRLVVSPYHAQESGVLKSMVAADVLIEVAEGVTELEAGRPVDIVYF
ncbi:MAG: molybdopterin molybdotransferase MoeA [bacterium]|nr:molybdopterin molybdotransferase MoeA [bacterium]